MWYLIGCLYNGYKPSQPNSFKFTHHTKDLVDIVIRELESRHAVVSHNRRNSHWVEIKNVHHLYESLGRLGLNVPKSERQPPKDLEEQFVPHFVRGFRESQQKRNNGYFGNKNNILRLHYHNPSFLVWFDHLLMRYAGTNPRDSSEISITYRPSDALRIYKLCYEVDWEYTHSHEIYLHSIMNLPELPNRVKKTLSK